MSIEEQKLADTFGTPEPHVHKWLKVIFSGTVIGLGYGVFDVRRTIPAGETVAGIATNDQLVWALAVYAAHGIILTGCVVILRSIMDKRRVIMATRREMR